MIAAQVLLGIVKEHMLFRQSAHFVEVKITLQKDASKGQERKRKKLARMIFHRIDNWNVRLVNALDVDLKITFLQNFQNHQNIMKNGKSKYVLMKRVIVHVTTAKITVTKIYMHIWHVCLTRTNVQVKIIVTVYN